MANMEFIQAITVGSGGAASIDFTSIPQTYTDLCLRMSTRGTNSQEYYSLQVRLNSSSATSQYYTKDVYGYTTGQGSGGQAGLSYLYTGNPTANGATANTFGNLEFYFPNYTSSGSKSYSLDTVGENNAPMAFLQIVAGLWLNSSAINQITLYNEYGNFAQHTTAYLYGVTNVTAAAKASGGTITSDGAYFYHTFTSSGTFTPASALTADVLLVAGGGGGGYDQYSGGRGAGGGGAGGLLALSSQALSATAYTVTVGAGGTSASLGSSGSGTNSTFQTLTAAVGGGGGGGNNTGGGSDNGGNGGSGGGAASAATVGTGVSGQGFAGGNNPGDNYAGGGGGGATEVGKQGPAAGGTGIGGAGSNAYSTWASITNTGAGGYYAGGGGGQNQSGGSDGGVGGGGHGATGGTSNSGVTAGTARTGGGGGGGRPGGNGGSGVIIVRYAV